MKTIWTRVQAASLGVALALTATLLAEGAHAQGPYPSKPIKLLVPLPPGGETDMVARLLAQELQDVLRSPVVVENVPGRGRALDRIEKAPPDGHEVLLLPDSVAQDPDLYGTVKRLEPIAFLGATHYALVVPTASDVKTLAELVSRTKGKDLTTGTSGTLSGQALVEKFGRQTGIRASNVPFKGAAQAATDLMGGHVNTAILPLAAVLSQARAGRVRILATFGAKRAPGVDVPTAREQGVPMVAFNGLGVIGPKGIAPEIRGALEGAFARILTDKEVQNALAEKGFETSFASPRAYASYLRRAEPAQASGGGGMASLGNCELCTSEVCRSPGDDCKVCCQK